MVFFKMRPVRGANWVLIDGIVSALLGAVDLRPLAVQLGLAAVPSWA